MRSILGGKIYPNQSSQLLPTPIPETFDIYAFPTQDLSATAESEPDMMKMQTPAKRSGEEAQVMIQTLPSYLQTKSL
ncbi:hypothetical protein QL285_051820 [Trifolium repens]|nr:hypothetical protein QL285_051820 [Trifolium repens]